MTLWSMEWFADYFLGKHGVYLPGVSCKLSLHLWNMENCTFFLLDLEVTVVDPFNIDWHMWKTLNLENRHQSVQLQPIQ